MKPIAKNGDLPFNVGGISVFAAVDKDKQAITEELFIFGERSTRVFDLINDDTSTIYTFMSMVSAGADRRQLSLSASAAEVQAALGKNQFVVKVYDADGSVLGYAYKFFTNKIILANGVEVPVVDFSAQTSVPVVSVTSVTLNKSTGAGSPGGSETLVATVLPANASNPAVTWSTSSAAIATVTSSGVVTLVANGTATITATTVDGTKTASCTYTVTTPVSSVSVTPETVSLAVNGTQQLSTVISPSTASNQQVSYVSDATVVATVDMNGLVTGRSAGTANITVTTADGAKTDTVAVTVA